MTERNGLSRKDEIIIIIIIIACVFICRVRSGCLDSAGLTLGFRMPTQTLELHLKKGTVSVHMRHTLRAWVENKRLLLHYALALKRTHTHTYVNNLQSAEYLKRYAQLLWPSSVPQWMSRIFQLRTS